MKLKDLVKKACDAAHGNVEEAVELANKWRAEDPTIDAESLDEMIQTALRAAIEEAGREAKGK